MYQLSVVHNRWVLRGSTYYYRTNFVNIPFYKESFSKIVKRISLFHRYQTFATFDSKNDDMIIIAYHGTVRDDESLLLSIK